MDFLLIVGFFGIGYFFQSVFGFGATFIIVLGLSLFIPIQPVIGMVPLSMLVASGFTAFCGYRDLRWKLILVYFLIALPGVVLGSFLLERISTTVLVLGVCSLILVFSLHSLLIGKLHIPRLLLIPYLLFSGFVVGSTGLGIVFVPVVMQQVEEPCELRTSLNLLWFLLGVLRLPIYLVSGAVTHQYLFYSFYVIPVVFLAIYLGKVVHDRIRLESFNRQVHLFLLLLVVARMISELQ